MTEVDERQMEELEQERMEKDLESLYMLYLRHSPGQVHYQAAEFIASELGILKQWQQYLGSK